MLKQVESFLKEQNILSITTSSGKYSNVAECSYISEGLNLFIAGVQNNVFVKQIQYNPKVVLTIKRPDIIIELSGIAKYVKTHPKKMEFLEELAKKDTLMPQGIYGVVLIKIIPVEIHIPEKDFSEEIKENKPLFLSNLFQTLFLRTKLWLDAIRFPFLSVSVLAVLVGTAVAFAENNTFSKSFFLLAFFGIALFHASADLFNDFFDHLLGSDEINVQKTPFSGGSRMIQLKIMSPTKVFIGAILCLVGCGAIGLYLNFRVEGNIILYIGLAGAFLGIFYVGIPFKLAHYGLGEIAIFLSFGPAIVFGSYYLQTEQFSWKPILVSILIGLLITLILFINQFPDFEADKDSGKKHLVIRLGKKTSVYFFIISMTVTYALLILYVLLKVLPLISLIVLVSLPFSIKASIGLWQNYENYLTLIPSLAMTILTCIIFSVLLSIALFVSSAL